jgi:hypothetical protein
MKQQGGREKYFSFSFDTRTERTIPSQFGINKR